MLPGIGLRSRILVLTMPLVLLGHAFGAGVVYLALGQVLEAAARQNAVAEVVELRADLAMHTIEDFFVSHEVSTDGRVVQIVDAAGSVVATSSPAVSTPMLDSRSARAEVRVVIHNDVGGLEDREYAIAMTDATSRDGRPYAVLVAVATDVGASTLGPTVEFAIVGGVILVALLATVTTIAVGQALRPVERMRGQIDGVSMFQPIPVLEVPTGRDELTRLAETLNGLLDRLRHTDASRRAFVADAGHELRSPLATIRVLVDRLAEERTPQERRIVANRAAAEVDRLSVLVDDLLTLASADEHQMPLHTVEVDLDDVVLEETGALRARGMPITVSVEPVRLIGDARRLGRVVRNLLENAERHCEESVRVTVTHEGAEALLVVDNDGPPVAPEERARIFGRFVRLDDSRTRDTGGTGLGLAIVAEIVRAHGGSVTAEESADGWCRFAVRLPAAGPPG
ncbi:MAG TPA: ATP-binding protein [Ornithinibacter sp.]|nr:ATP-binding protein [Ornithinibacter sp.]